MRKILNIVLLEPEIPQNTGNIGRTCAAIGANLHLIKPMGFTITEKAVKRAGLDYWDKLNITMYENVSEFFEKNKGTCFFATTKSAKVYSEMDYSLCDDVYVMFGPESRGIPEEILVKNMDKAIRLPMKDEIRSLNLSNAVCAIAYEVLRQQDFKGLLTEGQLTKF